jgi:hypothetical protein
VYERGGGSYLILLMAREGSLVFYPNPEHPNLMEEPPGPSGRWAFLISDEASSDEAAAQQQWVA